MKSQLMITIKNIWNDILEDLQPVSFYLYRLSPSNNILEDLQQIITSSSSLLSACEVVEHLITLVFRN
ncbi:unnamed protein product [Amoebophrya sp. A25]|nr:unnamed protein product [Amoebophrya sp. A25]|eukprot:GSA25T00004672001.1